MAKSRYSQAPIIDGKFYGTKSLPTKAQGLRGLDLLEGVRTFDYVFVRGDRLDHLAARFWKEDSYWWIIALVNVIDYPFASGGLSPGRILKVPVDPHDILDKLMS